MGRLDVRSAAALVATAAILALPASGAPTETKLAPSDAAAQRQFGHAVAVDADTAVVASNKGDDIPDTGAAYVFARAGSVWPQQAKLGPSAATADNEFGDAVAVHGDTVVVGAPNDDGVATNTGSAFVFVRAGAVWTEQRKLTASDAIANDLFGSSVAIDADTIVIGVPNGRTPSTRTGSAYVFVRSGTVWTQQQKLIAPDADFNDAFGRSVAVRGDTAIVGASDEGLLSHAGSAYVFVRNGASWTFQQKLVAADASEESRFGYSVGLSGETAVVGAPYFGVPSANNGAAYVFVRSGATWTQQDKLIASDATIDTPQFGLSVSVSGDTVVSGAAADDDKGVFAGAAYVFARSGTSWRQSGKLTASDGVAGDQLGSFVSVSGDTALAGAPIENAGGTNAGSAYVFEGLAGPAGRSVSHDSFLLPKKVVVTTNAKTPSKSKVTISGTIDEGALDPSWTEASTLEVGTATFPIPGMIAKGKSFEHSEPGLLFRVTPAKSGSSRGTFLLVRTADLTNEVARDGALHLRFVGTRIDAKGTVTLANGKYSLGKVRSRLVIPCIFPQSVAATLKGPSQDKVTLVMGFETAGYDVTIVPCIKIGIGGAFTAEIPRGSFTVKKQTLVFKGDVNGITDVVIDLAKELITVKGKAMTLAGLTAASGPVTITLALDTLARGVDERSVTVQLVGAGTSLKY